jgi:hypothetical protein
VISSEPDRETSREPGREQSPQTSASSAGEAVEVLREVWAARGQTSEDLAEIFGPAKSCKTMQNVGFDAMADGDGDLRAAWRATLERDGKLSREARSVRDLVLGSAES